MPEFDSTQVEYRDIEGFPGYRVGSDGSVWTKWERRSLGMGKGSASFIGEAWKIKTCKERKKDHYAAVGLCRDGKMHSKRVHALILEAFRGPRPAGLICRHLDGNGYNNNIENLQWGTPLENMQDRDRHGRVPRGENCRHAKLKATDIPVIFALHAQGLSSSEIANRYDMKSGTICQILRRERWNHVPI